MRIDWRALMRCGIGGMGLPPEVFWSLTPIEFLVLAGREDPAATFDRGAFERLSAAFPDRSEGVEKR